jgi:plasmid maintenance system antidote protein VapI
MKKRSPHGHFPAGTGIRPKEWSAEEMVQVKAFVKAHHAQRTPERKLKNNMLSIQYRMEYYTDSEKITEKELISLEEFLQMYLKVLGISFTKFAQSIDANARSLKNCLSGDRRFNAELACKFSHFFRTTPDLWMKIYVKNQLLCLEKDRKNFHKYKKYNYENFVKLTL